MSACSRKDSNVIFPYCLASQLSVNHVGIVIGEQHGEVGLHTVEHLHLHLLLRIEEQAVVDVIRDRGEIHLNTLAEALHTPVYKLMSVLVELDCKKVISTLPGCRYTLI